MTPVNFYGLRLIIIGSLKMSTCHLSETISYLIVIVTNDLHDQIPFPIWSSDHCYIIYDFWRIIGFHYSLLELIGDLLPLIVIDPLAVPSGSNNFPCEVMDVYSLFDVQSLTPVNGQESVGIFNVYLLISIIIDSYQLSLIHIHYHWLMLIAIDLC